MRHRYARCRRSAGVEGHITSERNASEPERSHVRPQAAEPTGPHREGEEPKPMMHGHEKSNSAIVATKPPNKAGRPAAEAVERRAEAKENANRCRTCRTQCRESVSPTPERVRKAEASRQTSEVGAVCRKAARTVLCGGRPVMGVPTALYEDDAGIDSAQDNHQVIVPVFHQVVDGPALQLERYNLRAERWLPSAPTAAVDAASSLPEYSERRSATVRRHCVRPRGGRGSSHRTRLRTSRRGRPSAARGDPCSGHSSLLRTAIHYLTSRRVRSGSRKLTRSRQS